MPEAGDYNAEVSHPNRSRRAKSPSANPAPAEIRAAREAAGLTQTEAAELVHSTLRAWQNWETESGDEQRRMHPATWELFRVKVVARDLVKRGKIRSATIEELGLYLPPQADA